MNSENMSVHKNVHEKLRHFIETKTIPNIIFHGLSGSGKSTIMSSFLLEIYDNDVNKMNANTMIVNCSHGKGIKFIREELKFFAKTNIESNFNALFKSIVLLNAESLTIDAQSALRRCIEIFSKKTRFFILIENKHKLLNPIVSRFCQLYIPEEIHSVTGNSINLHQQHIITKLQYKNIQVKKDFFFSLIQNNSKKTHEDFIHLSTLLYDNAYSAIDIINNIQSIHTMTDMDYNNVLLYYHTIKFEFRCEKMLLLFILIKIFTNQ
jgi:GTPase SAR1 family protein